MLLRQLLAMIKTLNNLAAIELIRATLEIKQSKPDSQAVLRHLGKPDHAVADHDVKLWHQKVAQRLGRGDFYLVCQPNCDGFAVSLAYKHGLLAKVEPISGDLTVQSITDIARKVSSIPKRLTGAEPPAHLEVVGHLYVPMPDGVSRPAGGLSGLKLFVNGISSSTAGRVPANQWAALAYLKAAGFNVSSEIKLVRTPGEILAYYDTLAQNPSIRDFPCKGMTVKVNRFDRQSLLSESADGANWALSYGLPAKANADVATPKEAQGLARELLSKRQPLRGLNVAVEIKSAQLSALDGESKVQELGGSIIRDLNEKADYIITDNANRGMLKARLMKARTVGLRDFVVYCNNLQTMTRLDDLTAGI